MTAQVEDKANDLGLHDEKTLKSNKTMRHSPDIDSYIPARHSSLSEVITLTPQSLSPRTNSSTGPLHGSFHEIDDLPKDHSSSRDDSFGSPRVELVPEQGDRSATHSPKAESAVEAKQNTGYVEHEPSKKRRVDEHDDSAEVEAYEELRKNAFAALQYIEQDFAKLRQRLAKLTSVTLIVPLLLTVSPFDCIDCIMNGYLSSTEKLKPSLLADIQSMRWQWQISIDDEKSN